MTTSHTFAGLLLEHVRDRAHRPALREKTLGIWRTFTWAEVYENVQKLAHGLICLGVAKGDHVGVIGENRPELYMGMMAAQALGAIPVPQHPDTKFPIHDRGTSYQAVSRYFQHGATRMNIVRATDNS